MNILFKSENNKLHYKNKQTKKKIQILEALDRLTDSFEFDIEHESTIGWYVVAHLAIAVAHIWRHGDLPLAAYFHVLDAHVPAFDHVAFAQLKLERLATDARVELFAVLF